VAELGSRHHQLALEVQLRDDATLENYLAPAQAQPLLRALEGQLHAQGEPVIYICGPGGSGKSHLLQAACHLAGDAALYLPMGEVAEYSPGDVLRGVETLDLVCLDDIEQVLGDDDWEMALFDLFNRAREWGCRLLLAADGPPRAQAVALPDLRSRMSWGIVFQLTQPDDEFRSEILRFRAERRGLVLPEELVSYIFHRAPRSLDRLLELLDQLDRASLAEKRALSIPFVKQLLGW
jgi:DnaA family protein